MINLMKTPEKLSTERMEECSSTPKDFISDELTQCGYISDLFASPYVEKQMARKGQSSKDEFWDALSSNYDYLMDDGLIVTCREANSDLSLDDDDEVTNVNCWTFMQFIEQFKQLHDTLHHLQVKINDSQNESLMEEQKKVALTCKHFNDQGQKLSKKYPEMRDEILRHLNLLNNKWEAVKQSINLNMSQPGKDAVFNEITSQMRCLRRWLRDLEAKLIPVPIVNVVPLEKIEETLKEQQALHKEIEGKSKYVSALLKHSELLEGDVPFGQHSVLTWDAERVKKVANNLQHRWHSIWLQSLECQCILEKRKQKLEKPFSENSFEYSFNEEPLKKYRRLSDTSDHRSPFLENECVFEMTTKSDDDVFQTDHLVRKTNKWLQSFRKGSSSQSLATTECRSPTNDKGIMVGNTIISDLKAKCNGDIGKFEIVQDVGYSSETSAHLSNDELVDVSNANFNSNNDSLTTTKSNGCFIQCDDPIKSSLPVPRFVSPRKFSLAPDKYPSVTLKRYLSLSDQHPSTEYKFNKSPPDTFYKMTSLDTDACDAVVGSTSSSKQTAVIRNSNDSIYVQKLANSEAASAPATKYMYNFNIPDSSKPTLAINSSSPNANLKCGRRLQKSISICDTPKGSTVAVGEKSKRSARIREWLDNCPTGDAAALDGPRDQCAWQGKDTTDSSCDASCECTATESDGEKSALSDDVNNSVSFSQSCTGSVETVVPVLKEEVNAHTQSDRAGSTDQLSSVRMRKKKKQSRDRPWSVTELSQATAFQSGIFTHSTSDGAINHMRDNENHVSCSKKLCLDPKSSLTDDSATSCPTAQVKSQIKSGSSRKVCESGSESGLSCKKGFSSDGSKRSDSLCDKTLVPGRGSNVSNSSEHLSSCNSTSSKRRNQNKHKRRLKAEAAKQRSQGEVSSDKKNASSAKGPKSSATCNSNQSCAEDQSSVSDQVWDEYQDPPYLSEPYSEKTADEDQVKKLINFGDDYRAMLGSHSDVSSASAKESTRRSHGRSRTRQALALDRDRLANSGSDSDSEDFNNILATSHQALQFVHNCLNENVAEDNFTFSSEFADLVATCQTNLHLLNAIHGELVSKADCQTLSPNDLNKMQELIKEWETLQMKVIDIPGHESEQNACPLNVQNSIVEVQNTMSSLKSKLNTIWCKASDALRSISSTKQLEDNIQALQAGLATLQDMKGAVLSVSAKILGLMTESESQAVFPLRDDSAKLYQQWEDVYELSCSQLTNLQSLLAQFHKSNKAIAKKNEKDIAKNEVNDLLLNGSVCNVGQSLSEGISGIILPKPEAANNDIDVLLSLYPEGFKFSANENDDLQSEEVIEENLPVTRSRSCLWRAVWVAMPVQFVLIMAYCFSCLMEPKCCENMNNFDFSIIPQLRYLQGPPPV